MIVLFLLSCKSGGETLNQENILPLDRLLEGNNRYINNKPLHPDESANRKRELIDGQKPFAVILSCSDSRVPPEIVFDQGLGDLFVIRTAGNLVDSIELGSIEFAVNKLGVELVVVLGHEDCGMINSFINKEQGAGHIGKLLDILDKQHKDHHIPDSNGLNKYIHTHIALTVLQIKQADEKMFEKITAGKLLIVGAKYNLKTGKVEIVCK